MDVKVNYVGIARRAVAAVIDYVLWTVIAIVLAFSLFTFPAPSDNMDSPYDYLLNKPESEIIQDINSIATTNAAIFIITLFILYLVLNVLMVMSSVVLQGNCCVVCI